VAFGDRNNATLAAPWALLLYALLAWAAISPAALHASTPDANSPRPLTRVTFIPQWEPQAQFAGYYAALAKGFYREAGLDVVVLRGGPSRPPSRMLAEGRADFGTMFLASALMARDAGLDLVNLAQLVSHSTLLLVAKKSSGIFSPRDLNGRTVSMWGPEFRVQPYMFFRRHGLMVDAVPQGFTIDLLLRDAVSAASAMRYNELHAILNAGYDLDELTVFDLAREGLDFPEDGIYALRETVERDPKTCQAFVEASIRGWLWAFENEKEALDIVMSHVNAANLPTNRVHQQWMLREIKQAMLGEDAARPGRLDRKAYETVGRALVMEGLATTFPPFEEFHVPFAGE